MIFSGTTKKPYIIALPGAGIGGAQGAIASGYQSLERRVCGRTEPWMVSQDVGGGKIPTGCVDFLK